MFDARGHHVTNYVEGQDMMTWVGQGPIQPTAPPRTLGRSDVGIALGRARCSASRWRGRPRGPRPARHDAEPHERIDLPCEKDKFNAGTELALAFCDMGSTRHSPLLDTIREDSISAAEKIGVAVPAGT